MSKVLTFSRTYPAYHPKAGQPTHFVEKVWKSFMGDSYALPKEWHEHVRKYTLFDNEQKPIEQLTTYLSVEPKYHTIRAGHRWKIGDKFSPRVWSGKAYRSKQVIIGPDIEVKKVWDIEIWPLWDVTIGGKSFGTLGFESDVLQQLATNDGLSQQDLKDWFCLEEKFIGQIISWSDKIEYVAVPKPDSLTPKDNKDENAA